MNQIKENDRTRDAILANLNALDAGRFTRDLESDADASPVHRRRVTEYTAGIARNRRWLDFLIDHWARNAQTIHPLVRQVLRIGAYELVILDRPAHAVVDASVEQARRKVRGRKSTGFVNAILRQIERNRGDFPEPDSGDRWNDLAIRHSHPTWMVSRWVKRFGRRQTLDLLEWNNSRPTFAIRVNTGKMSTADFDRELTRMGVPWRESEYVPSYRVVEQLQPILQSGLLEEGMAAIQDESAGLVVSALDPRPGNRLVDACAAPGGKLLASAILMQGQGEVVAIDPNESRLAMAEKAASRHGLTNVTFRAGSFLDDDITSGLEPSHVLLDVPCSGLGVLAKRPDLRWRKTPEEIGTLNRIQDELLDKAARILPKGGLLVYATCTIEPEENGERVSAFLKRTPAFERESLGQGFSPTVVTPDGYLSTLPHLHGIDGAFAARLRRGN